MVGEGQEAEELVPLYRRGGQAELRGELPARRDEEEYDAKQREASWAGLLAALLFVILAFVFLLVSPSWGPAIQSVSPPQSENSD